MRHLDVVEEEGVLQFTGVSDHAVVPHNDLVANVSVMADLAVFPNDGRAFDHGAVFDNGSRSDKDLLANESAAFTAIAELRAQMGGQIGRDLAQRFPGKLATGKERLMPGLRQIKKFIRLEHGNVTYSRWRALHSPNWL